MTGDLASSAPAADALEAGDLHQAERLALDLLASHPGHVDALTVLFLLRDETGQGAAALALLQRIARLAPDLVWAREELAVRLLRAGRPDEAEVHARDLLRLDPQHAEAHHVVAMIFSGRRQPAEAEFHYLRAIDLSGGNAIQFANLAWNLKLQGRLDEARAMYERAVALDEDTFQTWFGWAQTEEAARNLTRARELLDRALRLQPHHADAHLFDAVLRARQGDHAQALARLQVLANDEGAADIAPAVALEMGRVLDKLGRYDEAFTAFTLGKRLIRDKGHVYNAAWAAEQDSRLKAFFQAERVCLLPRAETAPGPQPLFICGSPRSGTTLVEQMLTRHADIGAGDELRGVAETIDAMPRLLQSRLEYPEALAELWLGDRNDGLDALRDVYLRSARRAGAMAQGKRLFTDKMPFNETHLGLMGLLFPQAPIIHMLRHPLDAVLSMFSHDMTHGMGCTTALITAAQEYVRVAELVGHYRAALPLQYLNVRYEDVVRDPETELRRMSAFIGTEFDPACLAFHENPRYARTASYAQVTSKLYADSCNRYRHYRVHLEPVIPILQGVIEAQGYEIEF